MPKTKLGLWSVLLIIVMPILFFVGFSLTNSLYKSIASGKTILEDITLRPLLALSMLAGMLAGILSFIAGTIALIRKKERSPFVYISTAVGALLIIFLIGEIIYPH